MGLSSSNNINGIKHSNIIKEEDISQKLYNSIVKIKIIKNNKEIIKSTGFFMKMKINNKTFKYLISCGNIISYDDINNKLIIFILKFYKLL